VPYDPGVAERVREIFFERHDLDEKKMFGGIAFMIRGHMCCGVLGETLIARVGPNQYAEALKKPYAREMDFTGKPMKGLVTVGPLGFASDDNLHDWLALCLRFVDSLPPK